MLRPPPDQEITGNILYKDEARNALARAIFFNRLGELRDRAFENQQHRASGPRADSNRLKLARETARKEASGKHQA